jgi:cobalt-zinc-cadmium efflux system protein
MSEQHHHPKLSESSVAPGPLRSGERSRLFWVMVLTGGTMLGELGGYFFARSIALLGDALHMLTHFLAIALSYMAIVIALRPAPPDKTYRYWRVEILATLINGMALLPIAGYVLYEAFRRFWNPVPIDPLWTFSVGSIGLAVNIVSAFLLHRHSKHDLNVRSAFLHMLADSASSVGVLLAAAAVTFFGWTHADPAIAAVISTLILFWCLSLLRSSCGILLESVPKHMNLEEIRAAMKEVDGVLEVHDLHVWTITSRMYALTAHVRLKEDVPVSQTESLGKRLQGMLDERYEINHATFQFEVAASQGACCEHEHVPAAHRHPHPHPH